MTSFLRSNDVLGATYTLHETHDVKGSFASATYAASVIWHKLYDLHRREDDANVEDLHSLICDFVSLREKLSDKLDSLEFMWNTDGWNTEISYDNDVPYKYGIYFDGKVCEVYKRND